MKAELYGADWCGYCARARKRLLSEGLDLRVFEVGEDISHEALADKVGRRVETIPQIFIDGEYVGGYEDLLRYLDGREG